MMREWVDFGNDQWSLSHPEPTSLWVSIVASRYRQISELIKLLGDKDAAANIAVKNLETAKKFYKDTLGLKEIWAQDQEVTVFKSGNSTVNVYRSRYAGTNQATAMTWNVGDDIEDIVQQLKAVGVVFEHYDNMHGVTRKGDVHVSGNMNVAWFKDPDGNILGIASG